MAKYRIYIYESLIHTHEVVAPNEDAIEEMIGDLPDGGFPMATETKEYGLITELTELIETVETHWDCECKQDYIHPKAQATCDKCGADSDNSPDSRVNEVQA